ncbi:DEAD/DEAH box helicase family protein [bacterium]|nr:DEAD/DEAH box helicase family protein [bacterium]
MDEPVRVRKINDPTKVGVLTGREQMRGPGRILNVLYTNGSTAWVPEDQLEVIESFRLSPLDMLDKGQLGSPVDLRRTLAHAKISGKLTDVIYSMEATRTDFYAYQFKPVLKLLESPSNGLLIADEVGLGKTIEAGLIWTELRSRFDMHRLVVLCPSALREKWEDELKSKMGVRATLCDVRDVLKTLTSLDSQAEGFALICSMQGLRPPKKWEDNEDDRSARAMLARFLRSHENDERLIDLLVIDEAHHLRNPETKTNELGELFKAVSEYAVFLTATPIHNKNNDLFSLLHLLDPDTFTRMDVLETVLRANAPLVRARDILLNRESNLADVIEQIEIAKSHPLLYDNRQLAFIEAELAKEGLLQSKEGRGRLAYRLETVNLLAHAITRTRKREVKEWRVVREVISELVPISDPVEREFYDRVTGIVAEYAARSDANEAFLLSQPQRQMTSSMAAALHAWQTTGDMLEEVELEDNYKKAKKKIGPLVREVVERTRDVDLTLLEQNDSKFKKLNDILSNFVSEYPEEKVVLFSSFRETLQYLKRRLEESSLRTILLMGGQRETKADVIQRFQKSPGGTVLLTSEVGGEGVDIQFCRVMINYDLPWNPMRLEQRIGRIDRLGQMADSIQIWNIMYDGTIDAKIYTRLYNKLDLVKNALGDFEAILGEEIRKLTIELLSGNLTPEQQDERVEQTAQALENIRIQEQKLEENASSLIAYGNYILDRIKDAKHNHRWISKNDLKVYVTDFLKLKYPGCTIQQLAKGSDVYELSLSPDARFDLEEFVRSRRSSFVTRLTGVNTSPPKCRFDNHVTEYIIGSVEIISQFHPLVQMISQQIAESDEQLTPAIAAKVAWVAGLKVKPGVYVVAIERWSFKALQSIEKLAYSGASYDKPQSILTSAEVEGLVATVFERGQNWLEVVADIEVGRAYDIANEIVFLALQKNYEEYKEELDAKNQDRASVQLKMLDKHMQEQERKLLEIKQRLIDKGKDSLVKATQGRIEKLKDRVEQQRTRIERGKEMRTDHEEIAIAVISVEK